MRGGNGGRGLVWGVPLLAVLLLPAPASAQLVLGYQLGVTQSVGTTLGDNLNTATFVAQQNRGNTQQDNPSQVQNPQTDFETSGLTVSALQGVQLNTNVTANVTVDMVTSTLQHGLVLGASVGQLIPLAVPSGEVEQAPGQTVDLNAQLRQRITTVQATATYLARIQQARWSLAMGANYAFGLNGRLDNGASGGVSGVGGGTLPAAQAGAFAFNGVTHTVGGQTQFQLNRQRWDLAVGAVYNYSQNGIYTLAAGALGAQGTTNAAATNLGAFIPVNLHTISPTAVARFRLGNRGLLTTDLGATYNRAAQILDDVEVQADGTTTVTRAPPLPPETVINNLRLEYAHQVGAERNVGITAVSVFSLRVATDAQGEPQVGAGLAPDTLIYSARAFYQDRLPWELRVNASLGAAQANLLQAPLGAGAGNPDDFSAVRSSWQPVAQVNLQRRFEPIDVTLTAARDVGVGALGASAIVTESGAFTLQHVLELGERRLITNLGVNGNRTQGVGRDQFVVADPNSPIAAAFNNYGFGVTAAMAMPIFASGPFAVDANLTYNFNWVNTDPDDVTGIPPLLTHVALLTLRAVLGRGTAQNAASVAGRTDADELDAFSANPRDGAPLLTQRLLQQGAPLSVGDRPGQAPQARRDSRQAYQQSIRQQAVEREALERAGAAVGTGAYQEEEKRAQKAEEERQKKEEDRRSREFGGGQLESVPLPEAPEEGAE